MQIADIFAETADQEKEHAKRFFKFLQGGDAHALAIFLTTQAGGITIMSRGGASRKELQSTVDATLRAIS